MDGGGGMEGWWDGWRWDREMIGRWIDGSGCSTGLVLPNDSRLLPTSPSETSMFMDFLKNLHSALYKCFNQTR